MDIKKQLVRLYAYSFASCLRITDAVWVVLLVARGYSLWQVGLAEGIFHVTSLLCEIPSGMAADLLGRRRSLAVAGLLGVTSALAMAFSVNYFGVCVSMLFSALACNFISGTQEAITYDSLVSAKREDEFLQVSANCYQLETVGSAVSNACSLLSRFVGFTGYYLLDAAVCAVRTLTALTLKEPVVTEAQAARQSHPFAALPARFRQHTSTAVRFLRTNPRIARLILADGLIGLPSYLTLMFLQQRLTELGLPAAFLGLPILIITCSHLAGTAVGRRLKNVRLLSLYAVCAVLSGVGTLAAGLAPLVLAVAGAMLSAAVLDAWTLHGQNAMNEAFPSDQRATLVSVNSMAYSILMIAASPLTGAVGDAAGSAGAGLAVLGIILAAAGLAAAVCAARRVFHSFH